MWGEQGLQGREQIQIKPEEFLQATLLNLVDTLYKCTETTEQVLDDVTTTTTAEAKRDTKAPIRLMTQFLRAVSEDRMEDGLALAQTSGSVKYR